MGNEMTAGTTVVSQRMSVSDFFLLAAVALSPLQTAFTLNVGFPFKACELLIGLAVITYPFSRSRRVDNRRRELPWVILLGLLVFLSTIYHLLLPEPPGPYPGYTRGITQDMLLYLGYAMLVVAAWVLVSRIDARLLRKAFVVAVWVCIAATAFQIVLHQAGLDSTLAALGYQTERLGTGFGFDVLRTGPFVEGNHLGFFAGAGMLICFEEKKYVAALGALACVVYSQSTGAIIALVVAVAVLFVVRRQGKTQFRILLGFGFAAIVAVLIAPVRDYLIFQVAKLGLFNIAGVDVNDRSVTIRSAKTALAWQMAGDNPLLGLGPGRFGVWFEHYAIPSDFPEVYFNGINRPIVENAYLQIASEIGIPALIVFGVVLLILAVRALRVPGIAIALLVFVAISVSTLSSWTFVPLWLLLAYLTALKIPPKASPEGMVPMRQPTVDALRPYTNA
jgi:O-antigen ligase